MVLRFLTSDNSAKNPQDIVQNVIKLILKIITYKMKNKIPLNEGQFLSLVQVNYNFTTEKLLFRVEGPEIVKALIMNVKKINA